MQKVHRPGSGPSASPATVEAGSRNEASVTSDSELLFMDLVDVDSGDEVGTRLRGTTPVSNAQHHIVSHVQPRRSHDQKTSKLGRSTQPSPNPPVAENLSETDAGGLGHEDLDPDGASQGFETDVFDDSDLSSLEGLFFDPQGTAHSPFRPGANDAAASDTRNRKVNSACSHDMIEPASSADEAIYKASQLLNLDAKAWPNSDRISVLTFFDRDTEIQEKLRIAGGLQNDEGRGNDGAGAGQPSGTTDVISHYKDEGHFGNLPWHSSRTSPDSRCRKNASESTERARLGSGFRSEACRSASWLCHIHLISST